MKVTKAKLFTSLTVMFLLLDITRAEKTLLKSFVKNFENSDGAFGGFARLYNQFDALNNPQDQ